MTQPPSPATPERMDEETFHEYGRPDSCDASSYAEVYAEARRAREAEAEETTRANNLWSQVRALMKERDEWRDRAHANMARDEAQAQENNALRARCSRLEGVMENACIELGRDVVYPGFVQQAMLVTLRALADEPLDDADYVHPGSGKLLKAARVVPAKPGGSSHEP